MGNWGGLCLLHGRREQRQRHIDSVMLSLSESSADSAQDQAADVLYVSHSCLLPALLRNLGAHYRHSDLHIPDGSSGDRPGGRQRKLNRRYERKVVIALQHKRIQQI